MNYHPASTGGRSKYKDSFYIILEEIAQIYLTSFMYHTTVYLVSEGAYHSVTGSAGGY